MPWSILGKPLNEQIEIVNQYSEPAEIVDVVRNFPEIFHQAVRDWHIFKAAEPFQLFSANDAAFIRGWFSELPRLWDTIKVNFKTDQDAAFYDMAEDWVRQFRGGQGSIAGLGVLPVVVIAGIVIAAAIGGVAAALWAVGYIQEQSNVSRIIDETIAGKLPPEVLQGALDQADASSPFGDVKDILKLSLIGVGLFLVVQYGLPVIKGLGKAK